MQHTVLIVDDEPIIINLFKDALLNEPYTLLTASSGEKALSIMAQREVDVVVSDEKMPGMSGSEFLSIARQKYPEAIRMIVTGHATLESAIRAINEGEVYRFFTKPCNLFDLAITIHHALKYKDLMQEFTRLLEMVKRQSAFIRDLEEHYPGITKVRRDDQGTIIIDDDVHNGS